MKTVILDNPGQFQLAETEPPAGPLPGQAVVRVRRVGICGTDIHAFKGDQPFFSYPRILGHELGVEVVSVASIESGLQAGDRCAVEPYLNCGACIACRRGRPNCCVELKCLGVHTDGGMRELITVPAAKLHRSRALTLEQLALVETLGIGAHAVDRASLAPGEFALVIGAGPIGLAVIQFAQLAGARVVVTDVNEDRLNFCHDQFKIDLTVPAGKDSAARILELTSGDMPTAVFDATGNRQSMIQAFDLVAHSGRLILVGLMLGDVSFHDPDAHRRELTLLCSRNSTPANFARIISLMESGQINTMPWITHRVSLAAMIDAFPSWLDPKTKVIKAMVEVDGV
ncbi:MAG: zinc-binding alcohol dehydrogenase family protein [Acidobacteria bacterium]|nr:zinc-binding alcohol dehydrogenase family protein [Acidobacteriota bacterium]MCI0621333.1 zinc-binding alcohol dehydrogenase family protein [Acidobacteriota bacterium]MCI0720121.1 zinc-binding alcohol dehydrogenase family protein [Acidobacteriota bacterium]